MMIKSHSFISNKRCDFSTIGVITLAIFCILCTPVYAEEMTEHQRNSCHKIIHSASASAAATGLSPVPGSDTLLVIGIQGAMIVALGEVFDANISLPIAKIIAERFMWKQGIKIMVAQGSKLIPGVGSATNAATVAILTEQLGWETAQDFHYQYLREH